MTVKLPADYPASTPECSADLPVAFALRWQPKSSTLQDLLEQYQKVSPLGYAMHSQGKALEQFQDLWDVLEDIDSNTWILEPEHPTYSSLMRRIALGERNLLH